jgi:hypothetical protein
MILWPSQAELEVWVGLAALALIDWFFWSVRK